MARAIPVSQEPEAVAQPAPAAEILMPPADAPAPVADAAELQPLLEEAIAAGKKAYLMPGNQLRVDN
jgi:putative hemolysin